MEGTLELICCVLILMLFCKDMSGKSELRRIREELEKMNKKNSDNNGGIWYQ